jgi:hypothetical protein
MATKNKQANILTVVAAKKACAYNSWLIFATITMEKTVTKVSPAIKKNSNQNFGVSKLAFPPYLNTSGGTEMITINKRNDNTVGNSFNFLQI